MKKRCILLLGVCILLLSLFSGCVNIATDLTVDENFSGTRKMTVSFDTLEAEQRITNGIEDIDHVIAESKPEALSFYRSDSYNPTEYVFTLSFSSLEDYISKVESITGEDEDVQFSYINKTFAKDILISESFDSRDLFKWFEKVLIDNGFASETALADGALYTQTGVIINIDGERYSSGGGNVLVKDGSGNLVNKISISTVIDEEGLYNRYITFNLKPSMTSDDIEDITEFFASNKPEGAQVSQSSDADKYTFLVQFSAASEAELTKSTSMVFGGTAASASVSDYQDDSQPLSTFEALDESFDLSNFSQGEPVEFSYQIVSDKGLPIAVYNVTAGDTESSATQTGNSIEYIGAGTSVSLKTVFESISTAQCVDYNLIMLSPKQFVREIKIYMAAGTPTEVLDQIALYYKSKSAPLAEISVDINGKLPFIAIVITGTPEQICSCESALFGVADRSLSYDRAGGVFSLRANSTLIDRFDISSLLSLTSSSSYIYTFVSEDTLVSYTYNDEGSPITKEIPKGKDKEPAPVAMMLSDGSQSITYGGKYTNVTAIIFICLLAILLLLLAALSVIIYLSTKDDDDEEEMLALPQEDETKALPEPETLAQRDLVSVVEADEYAAAPESEARPILWYADSTPPTEDAVDNNDDDGDMLGIFVGADLGEENYQPPEAEDEPEIEAEPEVEIAPEPEVEIASEPEIETTPEPEIEIKPEPEVEILPETEIEIAPEPEIEFESAPEPEIEYENRFPMEDLPPITPSPFCSADPDYTNRDFVEDLRYLGMLDEYKRHVSRVKVKVRRRTKGE